MSRRLKILQICRRLIAYGVRVRLLIRLVQVNVLLLLRTKIPVGALWRRLILRLLSWMAFLIFRKVARCRLANVVYRVIVALRLIMRIAGLVFVMLSLLVGLCRLLNMKLTIVMVLLLDLPGVCRSLFFFEVGYCDHDVTIL